MAGLPIAQRLGAIFDKVRLTTDGQVADYIPALAAADPDWFGVSLVTIDGQRYDLGDCEVPFTIQSVSKPFVFGLALDEYGVEAVLRRASSPRATRSTPSRWTSTRAGPTTRWSTPGPSSPRRWCPTGCRRSSVACPRSRGAS